MQFVAGAAKETQAAAFFLFDCNLLLCGVLFVVVDVATVAATAVDANFALYLIIFI